MVINVILRAFLRMTTMAVPDSNARWRASVPTARRGRIHAWARVLPGTIDNGCFMVIKVLLRGFQEGFRVKGSGFRVAQSDVPIPSPVTGMALT